MAHERLRRIAWWRIFPRRQSLAACVSALAFAIATTPYSSFAKANAFSTGVGFGDIRSQGATAIFLRYQTGAAELFGRESFYELSLGAWNGSNRNSAIAIARGIGWYWSSGNFLTIELGAAAVGRTTDHLGTHAQFVSHLVIGRRFGNYDLSLGQTHYSNAKDLFHWTGPNIGENFLTLEFGREF